MFDGHQMLDSNPNHIVFNDRTGGLEESMEAEVGDRIRLYVGDGGVALISSFHVVGEIFDTVYPEANMGGARPPARSIPGKVPGHSVGCKCCGFVVATSCR